MLTLIVKLEVWLVAIVQWYVKSDGWLAVRLSAALGRWLVAYTQYAATHFLAHRWQEADWINSSSAP